MENNDLQKNEKPATEVRHDALTSMLLPFVLGILLCLFTLCGMTWAWFSSTKSNSVSPIQSATYTLTPQVLDESGTELTATDGVYTLQADTDYTVWLTATGTAKTGFCTIVPAGGEREAAYTAQMTADKMEFTLRPASAVQISFVSQWGTYSGIPGITAGAKVFLP